MSRSWAWSVRQARFGPKGHWYMRARCISYSRPQDLAEALWRDPERLQDWWRARQEGAGVVISPTSSRSGAPAGTLRDAGFDAIRLAATRAGTRCRADPDSNGAPRARASRAALQTTHRRSSAARGRPFWAPRAAIPPFTAERLLTAHRGPPSRNRASWCARPHREVKREGDTIATPAAAKTCDSDGLTLRPGYRMQFISTAPDLAGYSGLISAPLRVRAHRSPPRAARRGFSPSAHVRDHEDVCLRDATTRQGPARA